MADQGQVDLLLQGVDRWNEWRRRHPTVTPDLTKSRLANADLARANLDGADLRHSDLSKAQMSHASLARANLESATLILADLLGAILNESNLAGVSFFGAFLFGTRLKSVTLNGANLLGATLMGADLTHADLSGAHLMSANLHEANLTGANLTGVDLTGASLVGTHVKGCRMDSCWVHGLSAWNLEGVPTLQRRLIITPRNEPAIWVDELEAAQLAGLLLYAKNPVVKSQAAGGGRILLVLGRFRVPHLEVSEVISRTAAAAGLLAVFADFDPATSSGWFKTLEPLVRSAGCVVLEASSRTACERTHERIMEIRADVPMIVVWKATQPEPEFISSRDHEPIASIPFQEPTDLGSHLASQFNRAFPRSVILPDL